MYYTPRVHDSATYDIKNTWFILELGLLLIPNTILMAHCIVSNLTIISSYFLPSLAVVDIAKRGRRRRRRLRRRTCHTYIITYNSKS